MGSSLANKWVIPSTLEETSKVLKAVLADVQSLGYSDDAVFAIRLAMDEALANAVNHGNAGDASKTVAVEFSVNSDAFTASVTDEGCGFCPDRVPDPTHDQNLERPCGRGVMLMKAYMSSVSYSDRGNCVTLIKYRNCPLPARAKRC